jgi:hypothetical protein
MHPMSGMMIKTRCRMNNKEARRIKKNFDAGFELPCTLMRW